MSKFELYSPQVEDIHTLKQNGVMEVTNMDQYVTGAVIKRLREEKNMTQQQLADKLPVSAKTISKWETAK